MPSCSFHGTSRAPLQICPNCVRKLQRMETCVSLMKWDQAMVYFFLAASRESDHQGYVTTNRTCVDRCTVCWFDGQAQHRLTPFPTVMMTIMTLYVSYDCFFLFVACVRQIPHGGCLRRIFPTRQRHEGRSTPRSQLQVHQECLDSAIPTTPPRPVVAACLGVVAPTQLSPLGRDLGGIVVGVVRGLVGDFVRPHVLHRR